MANGLADAVLPVGKGVTVAFVFGSVAAGSERPESDVDLMVLGSAGFADLARALATAHELIGREVNPTVMAPKGFGRKLAAGDGFALSVAQGPRIWLMGDEDDFAELAAHRKD